MNRILSFAVLLVILSCSTKDQKIVDSSTASDSVSSESIIGGPESWPQLDLENYKVYTYTDTTIKFNEPSYLGDHEMLEIDYLKTDPAVKRTPEGLTFQLKNGQVKILK